MSHSDKLRSTVGLSSVDSAIIKQHSRELREALKGHQGPFEEWFYRKIEWPQDAPSPLLPGFLESYLQGHYGDQFCATQYEQSIHWCRYGMEAEHALTAQGKLRQLFIEMAQAWEDKPLAGALCRVIDLSQAVHAVAFHVAHTLQRFRATAEHELARIHRSAEELEDIQRSGMVRAYGDHYAWKIHAYSLALGEPLDLGNLQLSPDACALGMWLKHGGIDLIPAKKVEGFNAAHIRLHQLGTRILEEAKAGTPFNIVDYLVDMEAASDEITGVLSHIINHELHHLITEDNLTHLGNRRLFETDIIRRVALAKRSGNGLGLLFIDIDHFKSVNDRFGHLVGDEILRSTTGRIVEILRMADNIYRWGGEEFAALVFVDSTAELEASAERLRTGFTEAPLLSSAGMIDITISVGGAFYDNNFNIENVATKLFQQADTNLHQAKTTGRNRVITSEIEHPPS
ncbi:MAG: sensor domain-containing diguanylate cyclase [Gammaproteobacteria bacterium]|nr:sensor domain-containing diguanylate cyclase [Gammaproteobacteria bacterium]